MKKNLPIITGIRFFAAFYVFIFHLDIRKNLDFIPTQLQSIIHQGAVGVNIFFILSGFILFYTYHQKKMNFNTFMFKRLAKIYPVYIFGFVLCLIVKYILNIPTDNFFEIAMMNLMMTQSYYPDFSMIWYGAGSWSISTEFFFYLTFPLLLKYILRMPKTSILIFLIFFYILSIVPGILYNEKMVDWQQTYSFPPSRISEFIIGMLTASLIFRHNLKISNLIIITTVLLSSVYFYLYGKNLEGYVIQNIIIIPLTMILLISAATFKNSLLNIIGSKPIEYLGKISYSFYIMHLPMMLILDNTTLFSNFSSLSYFATLFIINLLITMVAYHGIEIPLHTYLKNKIRIYHSTNTSTIIQ